MIVVGLNHSTADIAYRERFALAPVEIEPALNQAKNLLGLQNLILVSTCNRTEIYTTADCDPLDLIHWLARHVGADVSVTQESLSQNWYIRRDRQAVKHLFSVACGLDSLVLGEPQILGQLKLAWRRAHRADTIGMLLDRWFQTAFSVAKNIRTHTAIGQSVVSVAYQAVKLAGQIYADLSQKRVLLVGAGDTAALAARHFQTRGVKDFVVINRSLKKAEDLADSLQGNAYGLDALSDCLQSADIVLSSTASTVAIIGKGMVESALAERKYKPMLLLDLAVPRDIESEVGALKSVYLYTIDQLQSVIDDNFSERAAAAIQAEDRIEKHVAHFLEWVKGRAAKQAVCELRSSLSKLVEMESERLNRKIESIAKKMDSAEQEALKETVQQFTHRLTQKWLHTPTEALTQAARENELETLMKLEALFRKSSLRESSLRKQ